MNLVYQVKYEGNEMFFFPVESQEKASNAILRTPTAYLADPFADDSINTIFYNDFGAPYSPYKK